MKAEHTSGEWKTSQGTKQFMISSENRSICRTYSNLDQDEANAKLISIAPRMYQFLTDTIQHLKSKSELTFVEKHLLNQAEEIIKSTK